MLNMEEKYMLDDEIRKKREELNRSIEENRDYEYIYKISVELDELIAKYYKEEEKKKDEQNAVKAC